MNCPELTKNDIFPLPMDAEHQPLRPPTHCANLRPLHIHIVRCGFVTLALSFLMVMQLVAYVTAFVVFRPAFLFPLSPPHPTRYAPAHPRHAHPRSHPHTHGGFAHNITQFKLIWQKFEKNTFKNGIKILVKKYTYRLIIIIINSKI